MNKSFVIAPDTDIELFICDLQIDMKNQLTFDSVSARDNYFGNLPKFTMENTTFQRSDYTIRIPLPFDEAIKYTYCRYKNNDKYYYAFITNTTYSSNEVSISSLVTDVWQTYQFDIEYGVSFIEREHVTDDTVGRHTINEELETGEYIIGNQTYATSKFEWGVNGYYICLESTRDPNSPDYNEKIGGISFGLPNAIPKYLYNGNNEGLQQLQQDIQNIMNKSTENENAIQNVYMVHPLAMGYKTSTPIVNRLFLNQTSPRLTTIEVSPTTSFGGLDNVFYQPKNNKLLTYPYCYYAVSNGNGEMTTYRQENFKNLKFTGNIIGVVSAGNNVRLIPTNYKRSGGGLMTREGYNDEGVTLGKLPILNWAGDTYTAWLVNNGLTQRAGISKMQNEVTRAQWNNINNAVSINPLDWLRAGTTGRVSAETMKGDVQIKELENLHQRELADLVPPSVGGSGNAGDVNMVSGFTDYCIYNMSIKPEYARVIDGYFYKYGYKVNETKLININTRSKFNYIKTSGANLYGDIPQTYIETLKAMFNNGITFWHNPSTFLKYNENFNDNGIV